MEAIAFGLSPLVWLAVQVALGLLLHHSSLMTGAFGHENGAAFWTSSLNIKSWVGFWTTWTFEWFIVFVGGHVWRPKSLSPWLVWLLLGYSFVCRAIVLPAVFGQAFSRGLSGFQWFLVGLTMASWGMQGASTIRKTIALYWFVGIVAL